MVVFRYGMSLARNASTVSVPSSHDRTINATIEDVRPSIGEDSINAGVRPAHYKLDYRLVIINDDDARCSTPRRVPDPDTLPPFEGELLTSDGGNEIVADFYPATQEPVHRFEGH